MNFLPSSNMVSEFQDLVPLWRPDFLTWPVHFHETWNGSRQQKCLSSAAWYSTVLGGCVVITNSTCESTNLLAMLGMFSFSKKAFCSCVKLLSPTRGRKSDRCSDLQIPKVRTTPQAVCVRSIDLRRFFVFQKDVPLVRTWKKNFPWPTSAFREWIDRRFACKENDYCC